MYLRPRYSLLTLLVLTALVAGVVMIYLVPRRAIVSEPPTNEEQQHLDENFFSADFFETANGPACGPLELEYEYLHTWSGQHWRSIVGRPRSKSFLVGLSEPQLPLANQWVFVPESFVQEQTELLKPSTQCERVLAVVIACENPQLIPATPSVNGGTTVQLPAFAFRTVGGCLGKSCYLLTDKQHIFRMTSTYLVIVGERISINEISDAALRQRIAEELAKIPAAE